MIKILKLRNYDKRNLFDFEVSVKDAVKIEKLKEGEKPSLLSDSMFKAMFFNENRIKYSTKFLSYYIDISYEELLKNIHLSKNEHNKYKEKDKGEKSDYVAVINDSIINIEVNNNENSEILERNMEYAHRLYASGVKRGGKYKYRQVIQFNLNNFSYNGNEKIIDIYSIQNDEGLVLNNKLIFIQIFVPALRRKWYNLGSEGLLEEERYILAMIEPKISSSIDLGKDIGIVEEYIKETEEVMDDEFFGESYDKEWALKDQGKREGIREGIREIAKKMKEHNISESEISDITGLTLEEINDL